MNFRAIRDFKKEKVPLKLKGAQKETSQSPPGGSSFGLPKSQLLVLDFPAFPYLFFSQATLTAQVNAS